MIKIKNNVIAFYSFAFFLASAGNALPQMQLEWVQRYNGYGQDYDQANALAIDDSGNVYVTGSTQYVDLSTFKCVTIKYNKSGVQQWLREYQREFSTFNVGYDIAVDRNGNVYVAASTGLLRYDRAGELVWARSDEAVMKKVSVDSAGYIYSSGLGGEHVYFTTVKYDSLGVRHWRDYATNIGSGYRVHDLFLDQSRNVIVVGYKINAVTYSDYVTIKYSNSGVMQWWRFYNGLAAQQCDDMAYAGTSDKNENLYITGASMDGSGVFNCTTIKYGPSGDTVWIKRLSPPAGGYDLKIDSRGNICIASRCCGYNYVTKLDSSANMIWERTYRDGFISADLSRLVLDSADNIYASGFFDTLSTEAMAAFKYDSSGNRQYVVSYFYTPVGWNYPFDLAVDRRGSVYLTGRSNRSLCTVKFSEIPTGITPLTGLPTDFILHQNFPNPFNPKTIINYELRIRNFVLLKVYDIAGREVATLVNEIMPAGKHAVEFNATDLPSGVYFYTLRVTSGQALRAGEFEKTLRMVVVR
jgi:streptogramin lyase